MSKISPFMVRHRSHHFISRQEEEGKQGPELCTDGNAAKRLTPCRDDVNTLIPESKAFMVNIFRRGLPPACVKACPTGALKFGDKKEMLALAYQRAKELGRDASVYGDRFFGGTHVVYVLKEKLEYYSSLPANPKVASGVLFWRELLSPFAAVQGGLGLAIRALAGRRRT